MADDFASATAAPPPAATPASCRSPCNSRHEFAPMRRGLRAPGGGRMPHRCLVHLIITDPTPEVLGQELLALLKAGYTSFKVFMTTTIWC